MESAYDGHASKRQRTDVDGQELDAQANRRFGGVYYGASPKTKEDRPNKILLFTVLCPQYPITVDVMHTICSPHGKVERIVIFKKNGVQAMVEFEDLESAKRAKTALNGADIYSGCCTLKIDFAKPARLNVFKNDTESWDFTNPNLGKEQPHTHKNAPLLADPRYGSAPTPYGQHADPGRRAPMPYNSGYENYQPDSYDYSRTDPRYTHTTTHPPAHVPPPPPPATQDYYGREAHSLIARGSGETPAYGATPVARPYTDAAAYVPGGPPGGIQQGSVIMVYGLNLEVMNCSKLFNIFCLYGNVVRIKFLRSKEGSAMVQLGDHVSCERAVKNCNNLMVFGRKMQLGYSKQAFLQDVPNPHNLPDGSPSFMDFMGNRNNRFTNPEAAAKNRILPPFKVLHYFNTPPNITEDELKEVFAERGVAQPLKFKQFPSKTERSSTGLLEWETKTESIEALAEANHAEIHNPNGKHPFILKLCFSASVIN